MSLSTRIAASPGTRWTFGFGLPIVCFAYALLPSWGWLPTDPLWPRAAVLAWALTGLIAMALSTRRRTRGAPPSMLLGGLLAGGALFALAHAWVMRAEIVFAFLYLWLYVPLAIAPPAAFVVYTACAADELGRAARTPRPAWAPLVGGFALPALAATLAAGALRGTEALLLARLVEPEVELDARELAPLRAIGWLDRWHGLQDVRRTWIEAEPPAYRGRALRARQVLQALTGEFDGPPPGAQVPAPERDE